MASVVMAVGQNAVAASAVPGTRAKAGHNAADVHPKGSAPATQAQRVVKDKDIADAQKSNGPVHHGLQMTRRALENMAAREKGLVGEHVVDYHELKRLGGSWPHDDSSQGRWAPTTIHKLNVDKRPVNLALHDLPKVTLPGIDAVWQKDDHYTVTEAKASLSIGAVYGLGKAKEKRGSIPVVNGLNADQQVLHYLLVDGSDKGGVESPVVQMSKGWVEDRAKREGLVPSVVRALATENAALYVRRVVLVTFESQGAVDHAQAWADFNAGISASEAHPHVEHGSTREWDAAAIDAVDEARKAAHKAKAQPTPAESPAKPSKTRR